VSPEPTFKAQLAKALLRASKGAVEEGLRESTSAHAAGRFLDSSHPQIITHGDHHYLPEESMDARAFVAASCLGHFGDAWSYFAQGIRSLMAGEYAVAKHLLYYSELRSAFSILARHGVLIRSTSHLVLQDDQSVVEVGKAGTHEAVWIALRAWAKTSDAKDFILNGTLLGGVPISDWLSKLEVFEESTMAQIFEAIGYDLHRFKADQGVRNSASYGARALRNEVPAPLSGWFVSELQELWTLLEPSGSSGFDGVDSNLAAFIMKSAMNHKKKSVQRKKYFEYAKELAEQVGSDQPASTAELLVSVAEKSKTKSLLGLALTTNSESNDGTVELVSMVARSFLLARFSAAAADDLVTKSGIDVEQLDFWFANVGAQTGLWGSLRPTPSLVEILEDIKVDLDVMSENQQARDLNEFLQKTGSEVHATTNFALVAAWIRRSFEDELPQIA
jgi:hypothetical protein